MNSAKQEASDKLDMWLDVFCSYMNQYITGDPQETHDCKTPVKVKISYKSQ